MVAGEAGKEKQQEGKNQREDPKLARRQQEEGREGS